MFAKSYIITPFWTHIRLYCVELLIAKYYLFYLCRGQCYLMWQKADCSKNHCTTEPMLQKNIYIYCEEKTLWSGPTWQNSCQETTVEEAKQFQKASVGQGAQTLENRAVE